MPGFAFRVSPHAGIWMIRPRSAGGDECNRPFVHEWRLTTAKQPPAASPSYAPRHHDDGSSGRTFNIDQWGLNAAIANVKSS